MNNFRVKNHYVPEFYLKNWANNNQIFVYNTLVSHPKVPFFQKKSVGSIAYIKHFYTSTHDKEEFDDFEKWINRDVETPYQRVQNKILREKDLSQSDYEHIARFVMAQFLRVPHYYTARYSETVKSLEPAFEESVASTIKKVEQMIEQGITKPPVIPEKVDNTFDFPISIQKLIIDDQTYLKTGALLGRQSWLGTIQRLANTVQQHTKDHHWQIIKALGGHTWFTSDNPVTLLNYISDEEYNFKGAWSRENTNIFMPISPQYLLFTQVGDSKVIKNSLYFQKLINRLIIENSFLQVYSIAEDSFIPKIKLRTVNRDEYNRITKMLQSWHQAQIDSETSFWDEE